MEKVKSKNPKRKAESGSEADQSESKRLREWNCQLLDLSDDVLLIILSYVGTHALLSVSDVCTRLLQISSDASLWERIDTTSQPMKVTQFRKLLKFMSNRTTSVSIGGDVHDVSITPSLLESISIKCPMLEEFVLDGCCIDAESITISHFPKKVKKLALRNCSIEKISPRKSYMFGSDQHFESLEVLDLQNSNWLSNHSLQAISKIKSVREVNFKGCRLIGECFVYTAISTQMGFKNVKTVDLRDTHIGDNEVPCFGHLPNITHLYLGKTEKGAATSPPAGFESNGKITDRGVISMCLSERGGGSLLEVLALLRSEITNRSLTNLASAFKLRKLDLQGCQNITDEGIQSYLLKRPTCQVTLE